MYLYSVLFLIKLLCSQVLFLTQQTRSELLLLFFFSSILCLSFKHLIIQEMHSFIRNIFYRKSYISCKKYLRKEKSTLNYDMLIHGTTITKRITLVPANFLNLTAQYSSLHFSQTLTLFFPSSWIIPMSVVSSYFVVQLLDKFCYNLIYKLDGRNGLLTPNFLNRKSGQPLTTFRSIKFR